MSDSVVAIDVGGTNLKGALVDRRGRVLSVARRATAVGAGEDGVVDDVGADAVVGGESSAVVGTGADAVVEAVLEMARELAESDGLGDRPGGAPPGPPLAVGLAVPGLVDEPSGTVIDATNLHWHNLPIGPIAEQRLGVPVSVSHDVRAGAMAEGLFGAARGHQDYLLLTLGTGIGAAVVIGGRAYTGARGRGGELGHVAVDPRGPVCGCGGTGCLEALASAGHISSRYRAMVGGEHAQQTGDRDVSAEQVAGLAVAGDQVARLIWGEAIEALALAIANYTALLDPELVVIGGGMAAAGDRLFGPLRQRLREQTRFGKPPPVVPAELGDEAGRCGAAIAAWRAVGIEEAELGAWEV